MRIIELDGSSWTKPRDFYEALLAALGAPAWHGRSIDALIDSMVWGGMNSVEPPYTIRIAGTEKLPKEVQSEIELLDTAIKAGLAHAHGVDIRMEAGRHHPSDD